MISKEDNPLPGGHKKHAGLARPSAGNFARNEWAIIGGYCTAIKLLSDKVIRALSSKYNCTYADTWHNDDMTAPPGRLASGAAMEYTDHINHQQFNYNTAITPFQQRQLFALADLVLVNGNHQQANAQVVIIDINRKASLQKRVEQLTNVQLFLATEDTDDIFDFIKEAIPNWQQIPVYGLNDTENIVDFFTRKLEKERPELNGLVLAGGKSVRMSFDKGTINWHGKEQRYFIADMLKGFCNNVFISCNANQLNIDEAYSVIKDTFTGLGPYGAILSAFRDQPDSAWLVVACDLPLLDEATIKYLIANRDSSAIATAFQSGEDGFPEPLITIWEPKSYPVLLSFLAQGYSCPRKVLINTTAKLLNAPNVSALVNVNTPEDMERVKNILHQKTFSA